MPLQFCKSTARRYIENLRRLRRLGLDLTMIVTRVIERLMTWDRIVIRRIVASNFVPRRRTVTQPPFLKKSRAFRESYIGFITPRREGSGYAPSVSRCTPEFKSSYLQTHHYSL